ncbi:MAG: hypothetical protein HKL90_15715 [Elusimicrobia bacterium]|nr:hypothetical protein [Elusimicrobiota bacterium]
MMSLETGARTMLEHALDRAAVKPSRVITVINSDHRIFLERPRRLDIAGRLIVQPRRCGAAPGIFFPLTVAAAARREAVHVS